MDKAAAILGIGLDNVRHIPADGECRMRVDALREAIRADRAAGREPFCVVATAGTVTTGAVDPIAEFADVCVHEGLSTKARQWWSPCRPRVSTGVAPGRVHCGTGRLVGPQVATPSASERQYQQIGEPCPPTGESA